MENSICSLEVGDIRGFGVWPSLAEASTGVTYLSISSPLHSSSVHLRLQVTNPSPSTLPFLNCSVFTPFVHVYSWILFCETNCIHFWQKDTCTGKEEYSLDMKTEVWSRGSCDMREAEEGKSRNIFCQSTIAMVSHTVCADNRKSIRTKAKRTNCSQLRFVCAQLQHIL